MARVMNFSARGRSRVVLTTSPHDQLRLKDSANLIQALSMITKARESFLKFADEAQTPGTFATFVHPAHELDRSGAEIRRLMDQTGDGDPPCCE